jgi:phosphoribosyl-ATP pyrophosphohydrolase
VLSKAEQMVREFHAKYGFPMDQIQLKTLNETTNLLFDLGKSLQDTAKMLEQPAFRERDQGDPRIYRFHLMLEELGEIGVALGNGDEAEVADGLTDLLYVVLGTFVTYGLPISALFSAVHRSNMTKTADVVDHKGKGDGFEPVDIQGVLDWERCRMERSDDIRYGR